jgi:hypothetical protein
MVDYFRDTREKDEDAIKVLPFLKLTSTMTPSEFKKVETASKSRAQLTLGMSLPVPTFLLPTSQTIPIAPWKK